MTAISELIRHDDPLSYGATALSTRTINNILAKTAIDPVTGCWLFTGACWENGYPRVKVKGKLVGLHRIVCANVHGLAEGLEPDHTCKRKNCINPDHLEPVTHLENTLRGDGPTALNAVKTTCPEGHPYDYVQPDGRRVCTICRNARKRWRRISDCH